MPLAVCATPIGNLGDVSARVLEELRAADLVLCEDTRHTRRLLDRYEIEPPAVWSYHRHNEAQRGDEVLARLRAGSRVALVSDAGMPGICDPGARVVRAAIDAGVAVTVLPGPSAVETALVLSGLVGDQYRFLGWLPRTAAARDALWNELSRWQHPAVGFDAPGRLAATLDSLAAFDSAREVAVCRELTKRFEDVVRGPAVEVAAICAGPQRGEVTVVIGPAAAVVDPDSAGDAAALDAVAELVAAGARRRTAADVVARLTGVRPNRLYRESL